MKKIDINEHTFKAQCYSKSDCRGTLEMAGIEAHWAYSTGTEVLSEGANPQQSLDSWTWFIRDLATGGTVCFTCGDAEHAAILALATAGENLDGLLAGHFGLLVGPFFNAEVPLSLRIIP